MNSQLAIIVMIDVEAALAAQTLHGNTYLIDNNRFMGSTGEGTEQMTTKVVGNQIMNWLVSGIDISGTQPFPVLENVGGAAVDQQIMVPQLFDSPALGANRGFWWGATVDANAAGTYGYTLFFDIAGTKMQFVAALDVQPGFTMQEAFSYQQSLPQATALRAGTSLRAQAAADGSIANPDNHVSLFTRYQLDKIGRLRKARYR